MTSRHYGALSDGVLVFTQNKQDADAVQHENRVLEGMDLTGGSALGVFSCDLCEMSSPYSFYGQKPPNTRAIV